MQLCLQKFDLLLVIVLRECAATEAEVSCLLRLDLLLGFDLFAQLLLLCFFLFLLNSKHKKPIACHFMIFTKEPDPLGLSQSYLVVEFALVFDVFKLLFSRLGHVFLCLLPLLLDELSFGNQLVGNFARFLCFDDVLREDFEMLLEVPFCLVFVLDGCFDLREPLGILRSIDGALHVSDVLLL
jgi:hypothetical protein